MYHRNYGHRMVVDCNEKFWHTINGAFVCLYWCMTNQALSERAECHGLMDFMVPCYCSLKNTVYGKKSFLSKESDTLRSYWVYISATIHHVGIISSYSNRTSGRWTGERRGRGWVCFCHIHSFISLILSGSGFVARMGCESITDKQHIKPSLVFNIKSKVQTIYRIKISSTVTHGLSSYYWEWIPSTMKVLCMFVMPDKCKF